MSIKLFTSDGRCIAASNLREAITKAYDFHTTIEPTSISTAQVIRHKAIIGECSVEGYTFRLELMDKIQAHSARLKKLSDGARIEKEILSKLIVEAYNNGLASKRELGEYLGITSVQAGKIISAVEKKQSLFQQTIPND